jgi:chorismate dehydratase
MRKLLLGQVNYLNCLPVYHAIEEELLPLEVELIKGTPAQLNQMFLANEIDLAPLSSIEYARHPEKGVILPDLSISADGRVASILFFSKLPVTELEEKKVLVTTASATSVALLQILLEHYYHVQVEIQPVPPDLPAMLAKGEGALLIGDDAMRAHQQVKDEGWSVIITDLGEAWKEFTGEKMVYALWIIQKHFTMSFPEETENIARMLCAAKKIGWANVPTLIVKAQQRTGLPLPVLEDYFTIIRHEFGPDYRRALLTFYDYAYKSGLIEERVRLDVWGEENA